MLRNLSLSRQDDGPASASTDSFEVLSSPPPRVSSRPPQILTSGGPVDPDKAEKSATSVALTPHEIDRWYRIASSAGINVVLPNSPRSAWSQSQPSKSPVKSPLSAAPRSALPATGPASLTAAAPIPLIPAPPRSSGPRSAGGLRSFWKRGKKEDSGDEDNEDTPSPGSGYSRLGAPDPEEDESEDDKEGEKVFSPKTPSTADTSTPTPTGPPKAGTKSQGEGEGEASPSATDNTPTATPVPTIHVPEGTEATEKDKAPASAPPLTVLEEDLKAVLAEVLPRVWVLVRNT
jgi:hypothetical protein